MRLLALLAGLGTFAALLAARYLAMGPAWYYALYALPLLATITGVALVASLFEHVFGAGFRLVSAAFSFALTLFSALYAIFERTPGTFAPGSLPLQDLSDKAVSIGALGAAVAAVFLAVYALRSPELSAQLGATVSIGGALFVFRETLAAFGLPFLSRWSVGLLAGALVFFVVSAGMRRRAQQVAEPPPDPGRDGQG